MKLIKSTILLLVCVFTVLNTIGQANASLNILTLNSGQVIQGQTVDIQVTIGATAGTGGQQGPIPAFKIRAQISTPVSLVSLLPIAQQTGLPPGWSITVLNTVTGSITICNGTDPIPVNQQRVILIKVQGNNLGGPSTINGNLLFSNGIACGSTGTLAGDNTADNSSQSSVKVIPAQSCSIAVTAMASPILCNGETTTITATTTGANGAVEFSLNGGAFQTSNIFNNVNASVSPYTVIAREVTNNSCTATSAPLIITNPPIVPLPTVLVTQPSCTVATGIVTITSSTGGLTFSLDGDPNYNPYTIPLIVATGPHTLRAKNANGCISAITNFTVNAQPLTPAAPIIGTITQPTCAISTGSVVLNNLPPGNWIINPGATAGNTSSTTITSLASGTYNYTVTNSSGCISALSANVVIDPVPGAPAPPTVNVTQPTCTVATATISITSATAGLTFSYNGGPYLPYTGPYTNVLSGTYTLTLQNAASCISPVNNVIVNPQPPTPAAPTVSITQPNCTVATGTIIVTSATIGLTFSLNGAAYGGYPAGGYQNLTPGNYTLTAQNTNGCISVVTNVTMNPQPSTPTATITSGTITCFSGSTTLTVTASGGNPPYQYSLNGAAFQSSNIFTVQAGTYNVVVRGANLCATSAVSISVVQPTNLTASSSTNVIACNGGTTTLTVIASGGTTPYQYSLNGGTFQTSNTFTVGIGNQTVTLRDANGCTRLANTVLVTQPSVLSITATAPRITTCGGTTLITVRATGGRLPFTGVGTFVKGPGIWSYTVTDASGCTANTQIEIEAPGCMNLRVFPNPAKNTITVNHSVAEVGSSIMIYTITGALVLTKTIAQNSFITTLNVSNLAAGTYSIVYLNRNDKKAVRFEKIN